MLPPDRILSLLRVLGVALIVACHGLLYWSAPLLALIWPPAVEQFRFALPTAQLALLTCWAFLGPWPWDRRWVVALILFVVAAQFWERPLTAGQVQLRPSVEAQRWYGQYFFKVPAPPREPSPFGAEPPAAERFPLYRLDQLSPEGARWVLGAAQMLYLIVALLALRLWGLRVTVAPAYDRTKERLHMSLAFLLGMLTLASVGVPLVLRLRGWLTGRPFVPDWLVVASVGFMLAAITLACLWAMLKRGAPWARLIVLAAVTPAFGFVPPLLAAHEADWSPFVSWAAFHAVVVSATLGGLRACEYVLMREPVLPPLRTLWERLTARELGPIPAVRQTAQDHPADQPAEESPPAVPLEPEAAKPAKAATET